MEIKEYLSQIGRRGGQARAKKLTASRRKEIATIASHSRKNILPAKITHTPNKYNPNWCATHDQSMARCGQR